MGTGARERNERHNVASKMKTWEIRLNDDGSLDEVVADTCSVHLEQMDDNQWWLGVDDLPCAKGHRISVFFQARGKIRAMIAERPPK